MSVRVETESCLIETHGILWVWHCVKRTEFHGKLVNYEVVSVILRPDKTTKPLLVLSAEKELITSEISKGQ
jgi:hypothetical protein